MENQPKEDGLITLHANEESFLRRHKKITSRISHAKKKLFFFIALIILILLAIFIYSHQPRHRIKDIKNQIFTKTTLPIHDFKLKKTLITKNESNKKCRSFLRHVLIC